MCDLVLQVKAPRVYQVELDLAILDVPRGPDLRLRGLFLHYIPE